MFSQAVGVLTDAPQAPFHIASSGQVNIPGGLVVLGDTTEGHLQMDFNLLQSKYGMNTLLLALQPEGGDLRVGSNLLHVKSTNSNIGMGTINPVSHLHIAGTTDQFLSLHRTNAGSGMVGIDLLRDSEFSATDWRIVNDGGKLKFLDAINNFTGAADLNMTITQSGNVGIGTDEPEAQLHVIGTEFVSDAGDGFFQIGNPLSSHLRFDNNEILARTGDNAALLYLQFWGGNLSLCSNDAGRVGIGNLSPQAKLHITDGTDVTLASGGELVLGSTTTANLAMDGNEIQARDNGATAPLFMQASGGDLLLVPNETGQVGIGVTSSATMPSNDYLLAVDGKIISEEVRVEVSGSWPDYVFTKDYMLTPLDVLGKQISEIGHLPGLPSAAQVAAEGILLGEMQRTMLEKIEELTLYVIALQREVDNLKSACVHPKQ